MTSLQPTSPQPSRAMLIWVWLAWAVVTSAGWAIAWSVSAITSFSSGIYDPDEVEMYVRQPPGALLARTLIMGAFAGLAVGVPLGLYQWLRQKRGPRQALITAATAVVLTIIVCAAGSPGPSQIVGSTAVALSTGIAGGIVGGLWVGGLQYFLIQRSVRGYWVLATITGWAIAWAGVMAIQRTSISEPFLSGPLWPSVLVPPCGGALIGLAQWLFLRRAAQHAIWWIPAWALGWSLNSWLVTIPWIGSVGLLAVGVITASVLVVLLRHPREAPSGQVLDNPAS